VRKFLRRRGWTLAGLALALEAAPRPAAAHAGHCSAPETISTWGIGAAVAVLLFRPWRAATTTVAGKLGRLALPLILASAITVTGCGGKSTKTVTKGTRPTTAAKLTILEPTANEVTGTKVTLKLALTGATVVNRTSGALSPTEGHIHVSVDNQLVSMAFGTPQDLNLTPGNHSVSAEFVATDHAPFANRVVAVVLFTVKG
jgi:hypothetical protein